MPKQEQDAQDARWQPLSPSDMARLLDGVSFSWWICGGHAIDFFLGHSIRDHADLDIGVLRCHQPPLYQHIRDYEVHLAQAGTLRELSEEERRTGMTGDEHHGLWCRPRGASNWSFEVLLNDSDPATGDWIYRRHPAIRRPLSQVVVHSADGIPYLAPEVQLLFKAKQQRTKDEQDFAAAVPALSRTQRDWLVAALEQAHPGHDWIAALAR